jgi:hypothetical protein
MQDPFPPPRGTASDRRGLTAMADPRTTTYVPPDPTQIDASNAEALRYWSKALETPEDKLRRAVQKVGPVLETVKTELGIGGVG